MVVPTMQAWSRWGPHRNPFLNNGFALGFQLSWFHATSPCRAKRDNKWRMEYFTYLKRKKRAESKRDLRGWRFVEFSSADVRRMHEPFTSRLDPKVQKKAKACNRTPDQGAKMDFRGRSARKRHTRQENQNSTHSRGNTHESRWHHSHMQRNWNCQFQNFWEFEFRRDTSWEEFDIFSEEEEEGYEKESGYARSGEDYESIGKKGHRILGYKRSIGKASDRAALGLAPSGPLTLEELKKAFRESAMKWHPDRHQGPAKVAAEAKFKHCGAAYKSLTVALSSA